MMQFIKNNAAKLLVATVILGASSVGVNAAIETNLTALVTDVNTYWESIKTIVLAVFIFGVCLHYAGKLRR